MLKKTHLSMAVSAALGMSATVLTPLANAQEEGAALEEVVVTGSRIKKSNLVSASPVVQVDAEELRFQGTVRVEDMMRNLPQVYATQNTGISNGATGTATLNLRNLGDERTLVLINGRRMPAGSPIQDGTGADINQIPGALIKSVEVLTGGSSAVYGSDAVAGVINFKMMDDFQGVKLDYQYSQYNHDNDNSGMQALVRAIGDNPASGSGSDGDTHDISFIIGGNLEGGRGNITAYATYRDIEAVKQSARDYSGCALNDDSTACGGSGTIPDGRVSDFGINNGIDFKVQGNEFVPRDGTVYNYGPENYFQRPDERYTFGAFAHYDVNEHVEAYTELMFMDNRTLSQIAPSGAFFITNSLPCGNPLLSDQQFEALCGQFGLTEDDTSENTYLGRRNVEGGSRQQDLRHTTFRMVFGGRGDINDAWSYDVYAQYSEVSMENTYKNDLSITKIERALNAVEDPDTGEAVCQSVVDGSDPNCVPWDIFTTGNVSQEALDYLVLPLFARGTTDQTIYSGYVAADLGEYGWALPSAESGINVVFGAEYREENLEFDPDSGFSSGDGAGQGGATIGVSGGYDVKEFFMEASIPLVEGAAWAEELIVDAGYRYSDYSTDQQTDTYGIRSGWAINNGVKIRASYQRAVRAANVRELFAPQGFNLFDMAADPCAGGSPLRNAADCARSGVTPGQYGSVPDSPAGQYNYLQGGNPDLAPEESDTYSMGIVWTPEFVEGLSLTLDYYDIEIEKGINNLTPEFILNECLDGNEAQCGSVDRGRAGDLWIGSDVNVSGHIVALQDNLAIERVKGYDFIADYGLDMGKWGSLNFHNIMAVVDTWDKQELESAEAEDCAGGWGSTCGYPQVDFQNNLRTTWTTPWNLTVSGLWRHIGEVKDLNGNGQDLDATDYFDLAGVWDVTDWATLRLGVNNVFDEEPPIAGGAAGNYAAGNIFPGAYDALGRYMYIGFGLGF
jgi:iron complex outermembrane recepter protein